MGQDGAKVTFKFQDEHFVKNITETQRNIFNTHQHIIDRQAAYGIQKPGFFEDFDIDYNRHKFVVDPGMLQIPAHLMLNPSPISGANPWVQVGHMPDTGITTIKEKKMKTRKMLKPAKQIARRDLITAAEVLDVGYIDGLLDAVAIVQGLREGETLTRAQNLTLEHVGSRIRVIGGDQGVLSDLRPWSRDSNTYNVSTVIAGRLVELERDDYVVLNAEFVSQGGYIKRPNASDY